MKKIALLTNTSTQHTGAFINLLDAKSKAEYVDQVWDMLQAAYASIGGFGSAGSKEELIRDSFLWKLVRRSGRIVALRIYKPVYGRKAIASATDGSPEGKAGIREIYRDDLQRAWVECSGAVEAVLMKLGGDKYIVPASYAKTLTGKSDIQISEDGKHYTRNIAGHPHEKVIVGTPQGIHIDRNGNS